MDHCASVLLAFPPEDVLADHAAYNKAAKTHIAKINQLFKDQGPAIAANAQSLLDCLNPQVHSISYLAILDCLLPTPTDLRQSPYQYDEGLAERIILFLCRFDPIQIRYYGVPFTTLFTTVSSGQIMPAPVAVPLLANALLRVDPSGSMLTSNHLMLMGLAYFSEVTEPTVAVTDKSIIYYPNMVNQPDPRTIMLCDPNLPPSSYVTKDTGLTTRLTPLQVIEYDWLVGLSRCSRRDWSGAREAFGRAASHPCRDAGISRAMVEAFKKWVLVSLLDEGRVSGPAPPHASERVAKAHALLALPYVHIAEEFLGSGNGAALRRCVEASQAQLVEDGNEGLVREVLQSHQKWQIVRLRDVYARISLSEVRERTKSAVTGEPAASDAELAALIESMVASGMLQAAIEPPISGGGAGVPCLVFLNGDDNRPEHELASQIQHAAERINRLSLEYRATKERLATSKEFIRLAIKDQKRDKDTKDTCFDFNAMEDEDIMSEMTPGNL
ncbi:hypothetical protein GGTG_00788 [Gaeumannomyces tritici R3-111a-1]|uniref:COP9 signalosome complex subunit 3 N-terminal helical repeats domain-containing protein n=1 Tax=Gaeumannomyces tritici (strain R3-111a-1) TaxID=644352 RepID=J3NHQ1_GAET3|nr:hypothetical protein GGTG_00788 [Gaeumannomyces tritici R3-111a-1]EJT80794.1 hypothetical protein GGTG_00788 [Gaeumannomyces tritici R3-111a-1]